MRKKYTSRNEKQFMIHFSLNLKNLGLQYERNWNCGRKSFIYYYAMDINLIFENDV